MIIQHELVKHPELLANARKWLMKQTFDHLDEDGVKNILWNGCLGFNTLSIESTAALLEIHSRLLFSKTPNPSERRFEMIGHIEKEAALFPEDYK